MPSCRMYWESETYYEPIIVSVKYAIFISKKNNRIVQPIFQLLVHHHGLLCTDL